MFKDEGQLDDFFGLKNDGQDKKSPSKISLQEAITKNINKSRFKLIPKVLSQKERYLILTFILIILGSIVAIPFTTFYHFTETAPDYGGSFTEGLIGEPIHINPLLAQTNDIDRDLSILVYSSLMKYNENGKLIPDLAKSYEASSDGLNYTIYLREGAKWHDGQPITADDIVFTIQTAQNPDYSSPLRINWQGVDVEKVNDYTIIFKLKNKYAQFINNLTIGILPKHIWQNIKPINFSLSEYNLKPIGSGPYKFSKLKKDNTGKIVSYDFSVNKNFYLGRSYIDNVTFKFYSSGNEMIDAYNKNGFENIGFISPQDLKQIKFKKRIAIQELKLPRYFAVFFNQGQSNLLSDKNIRLALNYGTDKNDLIKKVLDNNGLPVDSPMLGDIFDINSDIKKYDHNPEMAKKILETAGWGNPDSDGTLTKKSSSRSTAEPVKLELKLTTSTWPELNQVAQILKEQWAQIGVQVNIEILPTPELQQVIKDRDYEMLLFGEILNLDPDPFSLWHSSQKRDPGLNLALYENKAADGLLEEARQALNPLDRAAKYDSFQKLVAEDAPAVFLYNPVYLYGQTKNIKGFESKIISMPSDRFSNIENWYINTKRTWK